MSRLDNYTLGKTLGSGFSAKVKHGIADDGSEYALKIFRLDNPQFNGKAFKLLKEEVAATTQLDHNNVVKYFEFKERSVMTKSNGTSVEVAYIAQEMISGGELFDYVANSGPFKEDVCKYFFKQMLQGIHYIHSKGFSHRDLKPENILLDKMYDVKIVDFGFACPLEGRDGSGTNRSLIGTPGYMAPEILAKQPYQGQVVDLFALGVILFILYSGHPPFSMANEEDNYYKLLATNRSDLFWKAHSNRKTEGFFSEDFKDLLTCMLQFHPHQRLCIADIIGHPWMASGGVASSESVRAEFANRHEINKQRALAEQERKTAQKNQVNNGPRRDFQFGGKVYLSHDEEAKTDTDAAQIIRLRLKDFKGEQDGTHQFFSHFRPDYLLTELTSKMNTEGKQFTVSDTTWKVNFSDQRQINDNTDAADGEESKTAPEAVFERVEIQVEISKVQGQDKFCVEFKRKAGSSILFYDSANKYIDLLELCNNTTLDADEADGSAAQE